MKRSAGFVTVAALCALTLPIVWTGCTTSSAAKATQTQTPVPAPTSTPTPVPLYVYVAGGINGGGPASTVYSAQLMAGGGLGSWSTTALYPAIYYNLAQVAVGGTLFCMAGLDPAVNPLVYRGPASAGAVSGWSADTSLPVSIAESGAVVVGSNLFVIGGYTSVAVSTVYTNGISSSGLSGAWSTTTVLPAPRTGMACAASASGYLYAAGGWNTTNQTRVYSGLIVGGTVAAWSSVGNLPVAQAYMGVCTDGTTLYVVGGTGSMSVYSTTLSGTGGIGAWTTTALPTGTINQLPGAVLFGGYLYLIGGYTSGAISDVYSAPVTGTAVGAWTSHAALPVPLGFIRPCVSP